MSNPVLLTFDYSSFIVLFPEFSNATIYPEARLQMYWTMGTSYISNIGNYGDIQGDDRQLLLNLLTAHIATLYTQIAKGNSPKILSGATADKISVTIVPPPIPNGWSFWMNQSTYGQQLIALLESYTSGGFYVSGYDNGIW